MANHTTSVREPLILGNKTYHQITEDIARPIEGKANGMFKIAFTISALLALWGVACFAYTIGTGLGGWG
jgi:molybdopterin-containing oxidoreductase family membrane subunit